RRRLLTASKPGTNERKGTMLMKSLKFLALVAFGLVGTTSVWAVKYGDLDGDAHPYVGLMVASNASGTPLWRCSGTLIAPRLFLPAGHCPEAPAAPAEIWFAADVDAGIPGNGYPFVGDAGGDVFTHPLFDPSAFFLHDAGMVVLDAPVARPVYGAL